MAGLNVAGKSGTAELDPGTAPHSWFIGFAPADNPQVAIAVLVERSGGGACEGVADRRRAAPGVAALGGGVTSDETDAADVDPRPLIERIGLGLIALVIAVVFGGLAVAAFANGEVFIGVMAGIGALMTVWAAASSLWRG